MLQKLESLAIRLALLTLIATALIHIVLGIINGQPGTILAMVVIAVVGASVISAAKEESEK